MRTVGESVKVNMMDFGPKYKKLGVDEALAISGFLTFKNETLEDYAESMIDGKKTETIHRESTKRGHASITTTPQFFFEIEGARPIDLYFSTFPFGSYIFFSSRRIHVTPETLIRPESLPENSWTKWKGLLDIYEKMWQEDKKDIARKILPVGFYSRGFVKFSAEDLIYSLKETRGKSFPRELSIVSGKMCEGFKKAAPKLFDAAVNRESDLSYHHPNIFHNDKFYDFKKLNVFKSSCFDEVLADFKNSDYYTLSGKMIDNVVVQAPLSGSIAVWNEVKRHRTILQKAESVYTAVNRAHGELNSLKKGETPEWIHIPPGCGNEYVDAVYESLCEYQNLKDRFGEAAAIYVVPHCVKLKFNLTMNGYHLLHPFGFFGVRECSTADYEIRDIARKLHSEIEEKIPELKGKIGPKCKTAVCPERQSCGFVERYRVKT